MIVVDASVVVDLLLDTPPHAEPIAERLLRDDEDLAVPHLMDAEVTQVLRRHDLAKALGPRRAERALTRLAALPATRYPHWPFLQRVWELRKNFTAYDGLYLALSEALQAPLLTRDASLADRRLHRASVELIGS